MFCLASNGHTRYWMLLNYAMHTAFIRCKTKRISNKSSQWNIIRTHLSVILGVLSVWNLIIFEYFIPFSHQFNHIIACIFPFKNGIFFSSFVYGRISPIEVSVIRISLHQNISFAAKKKYNENWKTIWFDLKLLFPPHSPRYIHSFKTVVLS